MHRGWMMFALSIEHVMKVCPSAFGKKKLMEFPSEFYWPVFGDWDGTKLLIDAVLARDVVAIERLNAKFPEFDFQLGEWFERLKAEHEQERAVVVRTLKSRSLGIGRTHRIELETHRTTGQRSLVESVYRGSTRVARKVLVADPAPTSV
jgi:hypothetical protein